MLRMRFLPGLLLGLFLGLPLGAIAAMWFVASDEAPALQAREIDDLSRRLRQAEEDKERMNRQLDDFRILAERMAKSFEDLEQRFRGLHAERPPEPPPLPTTVAAPTEASPTPAP